MGNFTTGKGTVIVIGGGISGIATSLYCVYNLGVHVILIEKGTRVGGRIHTIYETVGHGEQYPYEAGAGRIGSNHHRTIGLIQRYGLQLESIPSSDDVEYREVYDNGSMKTMNATNITKRLLRRVIEASRGMSASDLAQTSFHSLCMQFMTTKELDQLRGAFGYDAEFESMNALHALDMFKRDFLGMNFYRCKEGLSAWVQAMANHLVMSRKAMVLLETRAIDWYHRRADGMVAVKVEEVKGGTNKRKTFFADAVVCALPKLDLLNTFSKHWSNEQKSVLNSVEAIPLHRIYGRFPSRQLWFGTNDIKITSNNPLRQFIPISAKHGLAMVSYSDSTTAQYWQDQVAQGDRILRHTVLSHLQAVFPEIPKIPPPKWVHSYFWEAGVHMWKPGVDALDIRKKVVQPYGPDVPWFIVGEAYSTHQCWIEGALETVEDVMEPLQKHFSTQASAQQQRQGGFKKHMPLYRSMKDIERKRKWVVLRDPCDQRLKAIDVGKWMLMHPGGAWPFDKYMYQDITPIFEAQTSHFNDTSAGNSCRVKSTVQETIERFAFAEIYEP